MDCEYKVRIRIFYNPGGKRCNYGLEGAKPQSVLILITLPILFILYTAVASVGERKSNSFLDWVVFGTGEGFTADRKAQVPAL